MNQTIALSNDILSWISRAVEEENFSHYKISLDGASEKCDGYVGEIVFVTVVGTDSKSKDNTLSLVVKHSKQNEHLRATSFGLMFKAEIHFYNQVYPLLERFQLEKNINDVFAAVPKCLKTLNLDKKEVLILENLKVKGFEMYDRKKPLNIFHIKAVLEQLGKFHALSFAFRDQKSGNFNAMLENYPNVFTSFLTNKFSKGCVRIALTNALKALLKNGEVELVEKLNTLLSQFVDDVADELIKIVDGNDVESVIVHGDAWCNNFMFKYKGNNRTSPSEVAILDWQFSYPRSPVLDLAFVLYGTASAEELKHFDQLMKIYHDSFSSYLRALGSNPEELFPFQSLKTLWRKYSTFGVIYSALLLTFVLCEKENAPDFQDLENEKCLEKMLIIDVSENKLYFERYRDIVRHYFEYTV